MQVYHWLRRGKLGAGLASCFPTPDPGGKKR
jgi:hypothetical protein